MFAKNSLHKFGSIYWINCTPSSKREAILLQQRKKTSILNFMARGIEDFNDFLNNKLERSNYDLKHLSIKITTK